MIPTVIFTKEMCCALQSGFVLNPALVEQLEDMIGKDRVRIFSQILPNTNEMEIKYDPSEELKTVYGQIAKKEIERIKAEHQLNLTCGHSVCGHIEALNFLVAKLNPIVH